MKLKYRIGLIVMILLLLCTGIFATTISDSLTSFTGNVGIGTSTPSNELDIVNADANYGIFVDQNGATNDTSAGIGVDNTGNDGLGFKVYSDHSNTAHELVKFHADNNGFDEEVVNIVNDGTGTGLSLDQNGNGKAFVIDSSATTAYTMAIDANSLTSGRGLNLQTQSSSFSGILASFFVDDASATGTVQQIRNDGTGNGLFIDQNGNGIGLNINSQSTGRSFSLDADGIISTEVAFIHTDNSASTGSSLRLINDGTGPVLNLEQTQDVEVIDFDGCTDAGTSHTTLAGSVKVQMPDGTTGYLNVYT